jgi:hypothetical protein
VTLCLVTSSPIDDPGHTTKSALWPEEGPGMSAMLGEALCRPILAAAFLSGVGPGMTTPGGGPVRAVAGY